MASWPFDRFGCLGGHLQSLARIPLFNPYRNCGSHCGHAIAALMLGLALVGAVAAWKARPLWMFVVFALSFIPVGLYTLGVPGSLKWVGVSNTLLLVSGLLMLAKRKPAAA